MRSSALGLSVLPCSVGAALRWAPSSPFGLGATAPALRWALLGRSRISGFPGGGQWRRRHVVAANDDQLLLGGHQIGVGGGCHLACPHRDVGGQLRRPGGDQRTQRPLDGRISPPPVVAAGVWRLTVALRASRFRCFFACFLRRVRGGVRGRWFCAAAGLTSRSLTPPVLLPGLRSRAVAGGGLAGGVRRRGRGRSGRRCGRRSDDGFRRGIRRPGRAAGCATAGLLHQASMPHEAVSTGDLWSKCVRFARFRYPLDPDGDFRIPPGWWGAGRSPWQRRAGRWLERPR